MYINNKKGNNAATVDVKTPTSTSETGNGKVSFDSSLPQNAEKNNTKKSLDVEDYKISVF